MPRLSNTSDNAFHLPFDEILKINPMPMANSAYLPILKATNCAVMVVPKAVPSTMGKVCANCIKPASTKLTKTTVAALLL
jgi:hypothetical protein